MKKLMCIAMVALNTLSFVGCNERKESDSTGSGHSNTRSGNPTAGSLDYEVTAEDSEFLEKFEPN